MMFRLLLTTALALTLNASAQSTWTNSAGGNWSVAAHWTIASWRKCVLLDEGKYRLQALTREAHVVGLTNEVNPGNGAGIRISRGQRSHQLIGDTDWTLLEHEFEAEAGGED